MYTIRTRPERLPLDDRGAIAKFLAGYTGNDPAQLHDRRAQPRCDDNRITLLEVRRTHLELFAPWMQFKV